jgi:hypothetical protein
MTYEEEALILARTLSVSMSEHNAICKAVPLIVAFLKERDNESRTFIQRNSERLSVRLFPWNRAGRSKT